MGAKACNHRDEQAGTGPRVNVRKENPEQPCLKYGCRSGEGIHKRAQDGNENTAIKRTSAVVYTSSLEYSEGWRRDIFWAQELEISLGNIVRPSLKIPPTNPRTLTGGSEVTERVWVNRGWKLGPAAANERFLRRFAEWWRLSEVCSLRKNECREYLW